MKDASFPARQRSAAPSSDLVGSGVLQIHLLGGFRVIVDGEEIARDSWRLRKAARLVKILALAPEHRVHRDQMLEYLWPERSTEAAANNLRVTLHAARRVLESGQRNASLLLHRENILTLGAAQPVWVDVTAFEASASHAGEHPDTFQFPLSLYAGELLPDDPFDDWVIERRDALRQTYVGLLLQMALVQERRGEMNDAIQTLQRLLVSDRAHETAHVRIMYLHALSGDRRRALSQYQRLRDALQRDLDVEPAPSSQALYAAILANRLTDYPIGGALYPQASTVASAALRTHPAAGNLPAETSSFIGRDYELNEIRLAIQEHRLVTLTGPGGSGKTRLALRVAGDVQGRFEGGAWVVELAGLAEPGRLAQEVAAALGVPSHVGESSTDALLKSIGDRQLVLLLDNCEHLVEECARLVETLLRSCPDVRILATSREALRTNGELVRLVLPLPAPDVHADTSPESVEAFDSVRLFLDRARLVRPDFVLTESNSPAIAAICARLEGLPLAIEIAAARIRAMPVAQIAERVSDALTLLDDGARTAPSRQRTLRASMDWSYALLEPADQVLLQRLAVFAGGFTYEAALDVCEPEDRGTGALLDQLFHLVDKSLLIVEESGEQVRYRLLEPVRQYALIKLRDAGDLRHARQCHVSWCLKLALQSDGGLREAGQQEWLARMEREHDNMRAALRFALDETDDGIGIRLADALSRFWYTRSYLSEGRSWLGRLLELEQRTGTEKERGHALFSAGRLAYAQGDLDAARECYEKSFTLAMVSDDREYIAGSLTQLGFVALSQGDYEVARQHHEAALPLHRDLKQVWFVAVALYGLGRVALAQHRYAEARRLCVEGLDLFEAQGDEILSAQCTLLLAELAARNGDLDTSRTYYRQCIDVWSSTGHRRKLADALASLGEVSRDLGNIDEARGLYRQSLDIYRDLGIELSVSVCIAALAELVDVSTTD